MLFFLLFCGIRFIHAFLVFCYACLGVVWVGQPDQVRSGRCLCPLTHLLQLDLRCLKRRIVDYADILWIFGFQSLSTAWSRNYWSEWSSFLPCWSAPCSKVGCRCLSVFRGCCCSLGDCCYRFDFLSNGNPILYCLRWSGHVICHFVLSELAGRFLALVDRRLFRGWSPSYSFLHLIVIYSGKFVRVCFVLSSEFCCWWFIHWSFWVTCDGNGYASCGHFEVRFLWWFALEEVVLSYGGN